MLTARGSEVHDMLDGDAAYDPFVDGDIHASENDDELDVYQSPVWDDGYDGTEGDDDDEEEEDEEDRDMDFIDDDADDDLWKDDFDDED